MLATLCREEEFRVESGSSELLPKGPAPPAPAPFLNPYHKFCREQRLLLPTTLCNAEREKLLGKQWRALPEAERLEYKYKRATPMSEVLETALEIMTEEEATEVLGGGPSAEDRSPPPLLPAPLCVVRWRRQQQHGGPQAEGLKEQGADKTVAQQQGATADSSGPPLSEQPPPRDNESLQNYRYPESARAVLAKAAELRSNFDQGLL
eukprot:scaffold6654_cov51-Phaeocystis_antarctica.AAC.1